MSLMVKPLLIFSLAKIFVLPKVDNLIPHQKVVIIWYTIVYKDNKRTFSKKFLKVIITVLREDYNISNCELFRCCI